MTSSVRRLVSAAIVLAVLAALTPAGASAAPAPAVRSLAVAASAPSTAAPDVYESADSTPTGARDMTPYLRGYLAVNGLGKAPHEETHSFTADYSQPGVVADQDWFFFDAWDQEANSSQSGVPLGWPVSIEAKSGDVWVKPVIEVYGPVASAASLVTTIPADGSMDPAALPAPPLKPYREWFLTGFSKGTSFIPTVAGRYYFRVRPAYTASEPLSLRSAVAAATSSGAGLYTLRIKAGMISRIAGDNRVATSVRLSKERYPDGALSRTNVPDGSGAVVVANGYNFPDALAGSTLCGALDAPLLLTSPLSLDPTVTAEIKRLGAPRVFVLGGESAVRTSVVNQLKAIPGVDAAKVVRIPGTDRVATAINTAKTASAEGSGTAHVAFIANGQSFADALAASPMAAFGRAPVFLTSRDALDPRVLNSFDSLGITDVVILGSKGAVGPGVEATLLRKFKLRGHVVRIGGNDRYETAKLFAVWATGNQGVVASVGGTATVAANRLPALYWKGFGVAAGWNYPDALGGGTFAGLARHPLLLTPAGNSISPWIWDEGHVLATGKTAYLRETPGRGYQGDVGKCYVIGGPAVVSDRVWFGLDFAVGLP